MKNKKDYYKPIVECYKIQIEPFMANSLGLDSVDNVGLKEIDNYYYLVLNGEHDVTDKMLWEYLDTNTSLSLCADAGGTVVVGTQTFTIDNGYSYIITQGTPVKDSNGTITEYYFNVDGTGNTCSSGGDDKPNWN